MKRLIDLRSDTVTRPTAAMRAVMASAEVGDDVFGDDPTVNSLQARMAEMTGKEAGLFMPSGTQSNLAALMAHCQRGDEYIVGQDAHTYKYEGGGAAVLGSIQPQPIENEADGSIALNKIAAAIKPDDAHFARTRLIALENTIGGKVLGVSYLREVCELARSKGLAVHLDGARLFNAAVNLGVEIDALCAPVDSVSICLSKGLGAPVGSVLCGSRELIHAAHRARKMLGGGMRQAGVLAAAGLYALEHHVERLADDHEHARQLAKALAEIPGFKVQMPDTNIVFVDIPPNCCASLGQQMREHGIVAFIAPRTRLVTHLDVTADDIATVIRAYQAWHEKGGASCS